jgi:hypothetical protein
MESVIYNQDLCRHICTYLNASDILNMTEVDKEINKTTSTILPKYEGAKMHLEKLKQKYSFEFLQDCVQTYLQAELLYQSYKPWFRFRDGFKYKHKIDDVELKGKMRKVYNILRIKQWKRKGHPTTDKVNKRIKRLKVL